MAVSSKSEPQLLARRTAVEGYKGIAAQIGPGVDGPDRFPSAVGGLEDCSTDRAWREGSAHARWALRFACFLFIASEEKHFAGWADDFGRLHNRRVDDGAHGQIDPTGPLLLESFSRLRGEGFRLVLQPILRALIGAAHLLPGRAPRRTGRWRGSPATAGRPASASEWIEATSACATTHPP